MRDFLCHHSHEIQIGKAFLFNLKNDKFIILKQALSTTI
jgi:hypothetical protein